MMELNKKKKNTQVYPSETCDCTSAPCLTLCGSHVLNVHCILSSAGSIKGLVGDPASSQWGSVDQIKRDKHFMNLQVPQKPSRTLWGSWAQSLSGSPISWLQEMGFIQPPGSSLRSKRQVQTIREGRGCRDKAGTIKKQCSLRAESWLPLKGHT